MAFSPGMTVRCRGQRCVVLEAQPLSGGQAAAYRFRVRSLEGPLRNQEWPVLYPLEADIVPDELPALSLERVGRDSRFRLLHDAFRLTLAPPPTVLVAAGRSRIRFEMYQQIPALRLLALPRPRLLNASDVGLGKTIETGIILRELIARRRGSRILIVSPAGILEQWQDEMAAKFGLDFKIFDRDGVHETRKRIDAGSNPWAAEPRIIASFDYLKRRDGAFREAQSARFSVIVCDEVHHLADNTLTEDVSDRHRLAQWLARASDALVLLSATPHSGLDESFASLLNLLEPTLVPNPSKLSYRQYARYVVRHLKRHIRKPDGSPFFIPAEPSRPLPVQLTAAEAAVHDAVARQAGALDEQAEKMKTERERYAMRLVATILRKRAASSLAALRETTANRLENLEKAAEDVELRRDHLRALRKGETISDEALSELERDAHRSYLARIRAAGKALRFIEREMEDLLRLQELLARCPRDAESKAEKLLAELTAIHQGAPVEKVIVFSEYAATIRWLSDFLSRRGYKDRLGVFQGDLPGRERRQVLAAFSRPETLLLLSTDAASEGLNLQEHCRRVIHYELPFNPNRMLQRQGRVDRYGQTRGCQFGFLFAADTYEGEVLSRLFTRIENQVRALGSVGDVLGALQAERIEEMLSRSPADVQAAVAEAERFIEQELARVHRQRSQELMGDDSPSDAELQQLQTALDAGRRMTVSVADFVMRAIGLARGQCRREGDLLIVTEVPVAWRGGRVAASYDALYVGPDAVPACAGLDDILDEDHPLNQAAVRWVRESRYNPQDDHRVAARLLDGIERPDLIATFLVSVRAGDGTEMEQLIAVRGAPDGTADPDDAGALLDGQGLGNVPTDAAARLFGSWWEGAVCRAEEYARERAAHWQAQVQQRRAAEHGDLKRRLDEWDRVTRAAILAGHEDPRAFLPGMEKPLPPAVARRLREHRKEVDQQLLFLDRRLHFEPPTVQPLGVLLRIPIREVG
jgi:superfamily II DNA or RNA helicase